MVDRGDRYGVVAKDSDRLPSILDFTWMDNEGWYFIASCSSLAEGRPYDR